jgi:hypothetical protein
MAPIIFYVHYNGEITYGNEGLQYQGQDAKSTVIRLKKKINFKKLRKKICSALELDHHYHSITITFRCPSQILENIVKFMPILIRGDDDVNLMFEMMEVRTQFTFYELYITMEPITQHTTRDLHQTPVEECGPSSRHEYVPFEQSHLNVEVPMIAQGVQDDHLNAFMERVWIESGHDINMEHDEDEDTDIERLIINGGVGDDDDDDDNALDDNHGDQEHSTHGFPPMEAPSPSFIANTWDNIIILDDINETTGLTVWKVGMELSKGMLFNNKDELQFSVRAYLIKKNQRYKVSESSQVKWAIYYSKCEWYLRACKRKRNNIGLWEITIYNGPHTCTSSGIQSDGKMADAKFIERQIHHLIVADHAATIKLLHAYMKSEWKCDCSYYKIWDAKQRAIGNIYGDWDESYETLPKFLKAVQDSNPGTEVEFANRDTNNAGIVFFHHVFWAFAHCIAGFAHCRPVISIDGTHLYGRYEGKLLIAMATDANNELYPLAFAIVESENYDSWKWFLSCIRRYVTNRNLCIISDRHPGIIKAIREDPLWRPPNGHHRFCLRHVASNFNQRYKDTRLKNLITKAGDCHQEYKFNKIMETITKYNGEAIQYLDELTVQR